MKVTFPDGGVVMRDERFEDPLVYYTTDEFEHSLGLEFTPEYEYERVATISSRVFMQERPRLKTFDDEWLRVAVQRLVSELSARYGRWTEWSAEWPSWLAEKIGVDALRAPFVAAGWVLQSSPESAMDVWTRPKDPGVPADWTRPMSEQRRTR